ncbi:membrane protein [Desulfuromonas versatilis]|uniref:Membrane protein n=1 Tax=Desulfuromonas versatilis TaxID=2802975 RepID=A0ABN6E083_9BACT|nr:multidrug resistance efflux transporter family protein [Desulfuromonas versatilis]BCR04541.1 membrane protein [Desulfuromonas versatilis]
MFRLIALGILSAAFFSSTFILNRAMSLEGGHWVWSASLRYLYMLAFLGVGCCACGKARALGEVLALFRRHWVFWTLAGTTGFGVFYSLICFSASYAPGWVVATTWQTTILASPLVLLAFGRRVPSRALLFILVIFAGIILVNLDLAETATLKDVVLGGLPVLIAALAYPLGNQMVWEAQRGGQGLIPDIGDPVLANPFARIALLTLGSAPFWLLLILVTRPPAPSADQWLNTALVALLSGVVATGLFLHARHLASDAYQISAIDSTQSSEVVFSLLGEVLFLQGALPGPWGTAGIALTLVGLTFYLRAQYAGS